MRHSNGPFLVRVRNGAVASVKVKPQRVKLHQGPKPKRYPRFCCASNPDCVMCRLPHLSQVVQK